MKKIFLITTLIIFGKVYSQYPILSTTSLDDVNQELQHTNNGNYAIDTNNEREQYIGLWKYDNGSGTIFEIKITKKDQAFHGVIYQGELQGNYYYMDDVLIQYKLIVNNVLIYNNLSEINLRNINGTGYKYGGNDYLYGSLIDETTKVGVRYQIYKTSATSPEKIIFKAQRGTMYKLYPKTNLTTPDGTPSFFPMEEIEMIKIN